MQLDEFCQCERIYGIGQRNDSGSNSELIYYEDDQDSTIGTNILGAMKLSQSTKIL